SNARRLANRASSQRSSTVVSLTRLNGTNIAFALRGSFLQKRRDTHTITIIQSYSCAFIQISSIRNRKRLSSPYSVIRAETVLPSFDAQDVTISSLKKQDATVSTSSPSELIKELARAMNPENRAFKWYVLDQMEEGASYEL